MNRLEQYQTQVEGLRQSAQNLADRLQLLRNDLAGALALTARKSELLNYTLSACDDALGAAHISANGSVAILNGAEL